jgi:hypothetical protein
MCAKTDASAGRSPPFFLCTALSQKEKRAATTPWAECAKEAPATRRSR